MIRLLVALIGPLLKVAPTPPHIPLGAKDPIVFRASERWLAYRYLLLAVSILPVMFAPVMIVVGLLATAAKGKPNPPFVWVILVLLVIAIALGAAVALVSARLDYEFHCYVMTDRSVRIRHGIWEQVEATLTYANVQNVRVVQGPLERIFGISSVVVDTAGSGGRSEREDPLLQHHRGVIRGIENAQVLRDRIMDRMKKSKSSGLGDPDDHRDDHPPEGELDLLRAVRDEARLLAADLRSART